MIKVAIQHPQLRRTSPKKEWLHQSINFFPAVYQQQGFKLTSADLGSHSDGYILVNS